MPDCLFCKIIAGEIPAEKVYEDDHVIAFLDINPINPGHTLVVPKTHTENIFSASPAVMRQVAEVLPKISQAVVAGVGAEACNIGINNGPISGQVIFHLHIHIMPRFSDDGHRLWHGKPYVEGEMQQVGKKIRAKL